MSKTHSKSISVEPLLVGVSDTAVILGISKPMLYQMISDGRFGLIGIKFGSRRLFPVEEIKNWIQAGCPCREKWLSIKKQKNDNNVKEI